MTSPPTIPPRLDNHINSMGKVKTPKRAGGAGTGPYDRKPAAKGASNTNIFKFDKDFGQHILKNPGIRLEILIDHHMRWSLTCDPVMRLSKRPFSNPPMSSSKLVPERETVCRVCSQ